MPGENQIRKSYAKSSAERTVNKSTVTPLKPMKLQPTTSPRISDRCTSESRQASPTTTTAQSSQSRLAKLTKNHSTDCEIRQSARSQQAKHGAAQERRTQGKRTQGSAATVEVQLQAALQKHMRFSCTRSASRVKACIKPNSSRRICSCRINHEAMDHSHLYNKSLCWMQVRARLDGESLQGFLKIPKLAVPARQ